MESKSLRKFAIDSLPKASGTLRFRGYLSEKLLNKDTRKRKFYLLLLPERLMLGHVPNMHGNEIEKTVIIGAGLAGLTAGYVLARYGVRATILDRDAVIGATWARRHPQLTLNTHRSVSNMPGLSYPPGTSAFPKRDAVAAHLRQFADQNYLEVQHNIEVKCIRAYSRGFVLETNSGEVVARNVILATGRDGEFVLPSWKGRDMFQGEIIHSAEFGDASRYKGRNVLVIGAGNSGFDVLNHLSKVATASIWLSVRGGTTVLPKRLQGIAVHRLSPLMDALPTRAADVAIALAQRLAFGDLRRFGFERPQQGGATRLRYEKVAIPVDDGAMKAVRAGRIKVVGEVREFTIREVVTVKGEHLMPDVVIAATGYMPSTESLRVIDGYTNQQLAVDTVPGIWSVGMQPGLVSYFRNALREAQTIARKLSRQSS